MANKEQKKRPTLCVDLLNSFSKKELDGFSEFLTCSYFSTDKHVIMLFKALRKHVIHKHFFDTVLRSRVYEFVFKKQAAEKVKLSNAQKTALNRKLSLLLRLAEEFLAINNLRESKYSDIDYLYPELLKRKQHSLYKRHFKKMEDGFEHTSVKDIQHYENLAKFNELHLSYLETIQKIETGGNIEGCITSIDLNFLLKRLSVHHIVLGLNRYSVKQTNSKMYEAIKELLLMPKYKNNILIKLYSKNIKLTEKLDYPSFENLIKFIDDEDGNISKTDLVGSYHNALNFCINQVRKGNFEFYKRTFSLYLNMHKKNLLLIDDFLHSTVFTNIITAGCRAKQFLKAKELCNYYKPFLIKKIRDSVYHYNLGLIAFFQQKYEVAHSNFAIIQKTNTNIDFNVRLYVLQCLFESSNSYSFQFLQSLKSTKEFFKNQKKLPPQRKKAYLNFLQIMLMLYKFIYHKSKTSISIIEEQLMKMEVVSYRVWLIEKINELKKIS